MDFKFSVAVHILVMIAESDIQKNSEELAISVNTNPSYIRKITALLKKADIINSTQGKAGMQLIIPKDQLTLLTIYQAVQPDSQKLLDVHPHANPDCPVGRNIEQALSPIFHQAEQQLYNQLSQKTLQDVINQMKEQFND